jgi:hypothetical protein
MYRRYPFVGSKIDRHMQIHRGFISRDSYSSVLILAAKYNLFVWGDAKRRQLQQNDLVTKFSQMEECIMGKKLSALSRITMDQTVNINSTNDHLY